MEFRHDMAFAVHRSLSVKNVVVVVVVVVAAAVVVVVVVVVVAVVLCNANTAEFKHIH